MPERRDESLSDSPTCPTCGTSYVRRFNGGRGGWFPDCTCGTESLILSNDEGFWLLKDFPMELFLALPDDDDKDDDQ